MNCDFRRLVYMYNICPRCGTYYVYKRTVTTKTGKYTYVIHGNGRRCLVTRERLAQG